MRILFPTVKPSLKRIHLTSIEEVWAKNGKSPEGPVKNLVLEQQWQHRMQNCVNAEGNHFESDTVTEN
ncbi:hypothetical protein TNCV_5020341 [Trichonephila clavipes]|nr:hypothetical protein TNCV_5020341 [Trichonephila clavipes]